MKVSGYFEIEEHHLEQLDEPTFIDFTGLKLRKVGKQRSLVGNTTHHIALDNSCIAGISLLIKQGGEYRLLPYKLAKKGVCDFVQDDTIFYPSFSAASTYPSPFPCPLPAVRFQLLIMNS